MNKQQILDMMTDGAIVSVTNPLRRDLGSSLWLIADGHASPITAGVDLSDTTHPEVLADEWAHWGFEVKQVEDDDCDAAHVRAARKAIADKEVYEAQLVCVELFESDADSDQDPDSGMIKGSTRLPLEFGDTSLEYLPSDNAGGGSDWNGWKQVRFTSAKGDLLAKSAWQRFEDGVLMETRA